MEEKQPANNNMVGRIIFFIFIAAIIGIFWYFSRGEKTNITSEEESTAIKGSIVYVQGAVEYKDKDGDWKRAEANTEIEEGDWVEIVGEGKAIINLDDGSAVRLDGDSMVEFKSLEPNHILITNSKGQIYTRVAKLTDRVFEVSAGDVIYESMGTAYKTINKDKIKGVEVYQSKVKIKGVADEDLIIEEGNKYLVLNDDDKKIEKTIVKIAVADTEKDEFVKWNLAEDEKMSEETETADETAVENTESKSEEIKEEETSETAMSNGIVLTGKQVSDGVSLTWTINGIEAPDGFKVVRSLTTDPVYPGDNYYYLSSPDARAHKWAVKDGKTYYFRVCKYLDGKCVLYSNNVKVTAPKTTETTTSNSGDVTSLSISHVGSGKVAWTLKGYSDQGFKVVWSKNSNPTYPCRSGDKYLYYSDPAQRNAVVTAFDGYGTYYVRVCEYLGGKCGVYSNQITVTLGSPETSSGDVSSISLTSLGDGKVSWKTSGYSESGYKLVWSKNTSPTYPCRSGDQYVYYSDAGTASGQISAFDGEGKYYVRVCEYLGGKCGVYSNQIEITL